MNTSLDVSPHYPGITHDYEKNDLPSLEKTIAKIIEIVLNQRWDAK